MTRHAPSGNGAGSEKLKVAPAPGAACVDLGAVAK